MVHRSTPTKQGLARAVCRFVRHARDAGALRYVREQDLIAISETFLQLGFRAAANIVLEEWHERAAYTIFTNDPLEMAEIICEHMTCDLRLHPSDPTIVVLN